MLSLALVVITVTARAQDASGGAPTDGDDAPPAATAERPHSNDPRDYLKFSTTLTADCMLHRAQLRQIVNTHPTRAIKVVLWNYTGKTRSQGSSTKILPPHAKPEPLGCDGMSGLKRHWEIESAEFVAINDPPDDK
ncbi:hypothetical protein [Salinisphaera aquimarina]|uniref:Secreted protein n=1 Tax=Salinisphaera aquimarina TaxID=2094031 RepID=A0ABV7ELC0_9GAMM